MGIPNAYSAAWIVVLSEYQHPLFCDRYPPFRPRRKKTLDGLAVPKKVDLSIGYGRVTIEKFNARFGHGEEEFVNRVSLKFARKRPIKISHTERALRPARSNN
jgi:hypothetical protein